MFNYNILPEHMREGTKLYVEHGIITGSFLTAVMEDSLVGALGQADDINRTYLLDWAKFLYNECPSECWGSREKVEKWCEAGGLSGLQKAPEEVPHE